MKSWLALIFCLVLTQAAGAQAAGTPHWLRYPAISPDGTTVVFSYKGDLWSVPTAGGAATLLTAGDAYEFAPVWSHDGAHIAFASDRHGDFDVFVMPAAGGEAVRLTFHSSDEVPGSFTADDSAVLFSALRQDPVGNAQFPTRGMTELYQVPVAGGAVTRVLPVPALDVNVSADGGRLLYHDYKGYESPWRKHHTSSVTRDIWIYDTKSGQYSQVTTSPAEDRNPIFTGDGDTIVWLSERGGTFNVWQGSLGDPAAATALTDFATHPVRFLSRANDGTLCFAWDGDLYTLAPGGTPAKIAVTLAMDGLDALDEVTPVDKGFTEVVLSPNDKELAYVFRGEIFVSSVEGGVTRRITDTPWQERGLTWAPDGRTLAYAAEKDGSWNLYTVSIRRESEPYFYASTLLDTDTVVATDAEEFQPRFSPDGKEIAYLENRTAIRVVNLKSKKTRLVLGPEYNYSYADGDQWFAWSPDSKWLLAQFGPLERVMTLEVGLVSADGKGEITNLTLSGYDDLMPKWVLDGKAMIWGTNRDGALRQGGGNFTWDVHALFFDQGAYDRFRLSKEDFALVKEQEEKAEEDKDKDDKDKKKDKKDEKEKVEPITIDRENLTERRLKLTTHTSPASDWLLSPDGEKLFYLTRFEQGNDVWVTESRTHDTKLLAKLGTRAGGFEMSSDGKYLVVLTQDGLRKVDTESGEAKPLQTRGEMVLKPAAERAYIFDHAWRLITRKFYVPDLHGVDWDAYGAAYRRFLPDVNNNNNNNYDFAELLSELLGELNASHTGCRYNAQDPLADRTASLGLFYANDTSKGLQVDEVIAGGPLDRAGVKLKAGCVIEKIDGVDVAGAGDYAALLNRKVGDRVLLSVFDPDSDDRWQEEVKPIDGHVEGELLYRRWVRNRRDEVTRLSDGRLGYVHVRAMNDASMRSVIEEALGRFIGCEALIVDTRFNGGGNIHEQLSDFLNGKAYFDIVPHGQYVGAESWDKWNKPSIVLMGESNYSDAHLFPLAYKAKGVGRTLGMPVPGTGTFVWWERQIDPTLVFGMPMGGWRGQDGKFAENTQLEPDIKVMNEPGVLTAGRDQQIEAAVQALLKE